MPPRTTLVVEKFTVGPFQENAYLVGCAEAGEAVIVDPGDEAERLIEAIDASGLRLVRIVNTHGHLDHIGAVEPIRVHYGVPFALHAGDEFLLDQAALHASLFGVGAPPRPTVDEHLVAGQSIAVGNLSFEVLFVPGHSPGHVAFAGEGIVLSGDCLFAGSIGRTDLPGGDHETLIRSIQEVLLPLGDETVVYAGHMEDTTIGRERATNPFLTGGASAWGF